MQRTGFLQHLLCLVGFIVLLAGCATPSAQNIQTSPAPSAQSTQTSPASAQPITQLKPDVPIPSSCQASPVYAGGPLGSDPWVQAQPTSSGIVAHLVYSSAANGTYRLPPRDGFFPKEGLYTKTYWTIDNPGASSELRIDGTQVSAPSKSFHDMGSAIMTYEPTPLPANRHQYTSYIRAPSAGCWRLQITSGGASGSIVMWVVE